MQSDQDHNRSRSLQFQCSTEAKQSQTIQQNFVNFLPDKSIHSPKESLLSWYFSHLSYIGLINMFLVLLFIGGLHLLLDNFIGFNIRVDLVQWVYVMTGNDDQGIKYLFVVLILYLLIPAVFCLLVEKALSVEILPQAIGMTIHIINLLTAVFFPMVFFYGKHNEFSLVGAAWIMIIYTTLILKLWSFIQVNLWCRMAHQNSTNKRIEKQREHCLVQYPNNLNLKDLFYFLMAPTLCYELNFPRTKTIRKSFVLKLILEALAVSQIFWIIFQQYMVPYVKTSAIPLNNVDAIMLTLKATLKLAIPTHLIWICYFYLMFQCWLNLLGELLYFADRNFYEDWWNAPNMAAFWNRWNMPVHRWATRHLFRPMISKGYQKVIAGTVVFFVSGIFHEYVISVPLKLYNIWAFLVMMAQVPLHYLSRFVENNCGSNWGNTVVWSALIIGQPLCIVLYYYDYVITHYSQSSFGNCSSMHRV